MRHLRFPFVVLAVLSLPLAAHAQYVASQVTAGNAASVLFAGTDADGGIDDWYASNGVVQVIVDDVGPQADLVPLLGGNAPPKVSEFAFTGCSVIDLGRNGHNNDHLTQLFTVGLDGVSPRLAGATPRRKPRGRERPAEDRRRTGGTTGRSRGGASGWSTGSTGCAATRR